MVKQGQVIIILNFILLLTKAIYAQNPVQVGSIVNGTGGALLKQPQSVYVSGNYAYVASSKSNALEIIDISNPAMPTHTSSLTNGSGGALLSIPTSVFVSGNYAYVTSEGSNALEIIDVSNPAVPVHAGSLSNGSGGAYLKSPSSVYVSGNYAYIASSTSVTGALEIVDISNPAMPLHKGSITGGTIAGSLLNFPNSVYISGNYAYVVGGYDHGTLEIIDVSNPELPVHKGSLDSSSGALLQEPQSIYVSGHYAYVASVKSNALEIADISNPDAPVHKSSWPVAESYSVYVSGNYAYLTSWEANALEIVDISDPSAPKHKSSVTVASPGAIAGLSSPTSVFISGNYAYVVCYNDNSLEVISLFNQTTDIALSNNTLPITVYPNPNKGTFQLIIPKGKQGKVDIINSLGTIIRTIDLEEEINQINGLQPGFYFLRTGNEIKKIQVE